MTETSILWQLFVKHFSLNLVRSSYGNCKTSQTLFLWFGVRHWNKLAMRTSSIVTAFLTVTWLSFPGSAVGDVSTAEIAKFCSNHVDIANGPPREPTSTDLFSSGMCIGYLKGHRDGIDGQKEFDVGGLVHCIPPDITNGQLAELYVEWAKSNSEQLHHPAAVGFARAMANSFPCNQ